MNEPAYILRRMADDDWEAVAAIYREGIATGDATFETGVPTREEWNRSHLDAGRVVFAIGNSVVGWAALAPVSGRCVYGGVAETSVYVTAAARGDGVGRVLLTALIAESEDAGLWTLQAGIFPENTASLALHERCGFRVVGRRERLGQLDGRWRDVVLLERRSPVVGRDATGS